MASVIDKVQSGFKSLSEGKLINAAEAAEYLAQGVQATASDVTYKGIAGALVAAATAIKQKVTGRVGPRFTVKAPISLPANRLVGPTDDNIYIDEEDRKAKITREESLVKYASELDRIDGLSNQPTPNRPELIRQIVFLQKKYSSLGLTNDLNVRAAEMLATINEAAKQSNSGTEFNPFSIVGKNKIMEQAAKNADKVLAKQSSTIEIQRLEQAARTATRANTNVRSKEVEAQRIQTQIKEGAAFQDRLEQTKAGIAARQEVARQQAIQKEKEEAEKRAREARINAMEKALSEKREAKGDAAKVDRIVSVAKSGRLSKLNRNLNKSNRVASNNLRNAAVKPTFAESESVSTRPLSLTPSSLMPPELNALNRARRESAGVLPITAGTRQLSTASAVGNIFSEKDPKVGPSSAMTTLTAPYSGDSAKSDAEAIKADNAVQNAEYDRLVALKKTKKWIDAQFKITKFTGPDGRVVLEKSGSMATQLGGARQTRRRNPKKRRATRKG